MRSTMCFSNIPRRSRKWFHREVRVFGNFTTTCRLGAAWWIGRHFNNAMARSRSDFLCGINHHFYCSAKIVDINCWKSQRRCRWFSPNKHAAHPAWVWAGVNSREMESVDASGKNIIIARSLRNWCPTAVSIECSVLLCLLGCCNVVGLQQAAWEVGKYLYNWWNLQIFLIIEHLGLFWELLLCS